MPEIPPPSALRSKDFASAQDEELQFDSPPPSPNFPGDRNRGASSVSNIQKGQKPSNIKKYQDSSLEGDDTESELAAIRESDLSDSTIQGSARVNI